MKKILFILSLLISVLAEAQTIYTPSDPESLFVPVQIMGSVRKVYVSELVKNRWGNAGNSGTTGSNFIGTTDNRSLRFRTNNNEQFVIDSTGLAWAQAGMVVGLPSKAGTDPANHRSIQYASDGSYPAMFQVVNSDPVVCAGCTVGGSVVSNDSVHRIGLEVSAYTENAGQSLIHFKKARGNWLHPTGIKAGDIVGGLAGWGYLNDQPNFSGSVAGFHFVATEDFYTTGQGTEAQFFVIGPGSSGTRKYTYLRNDGIWEQPALGGTGNSLMGLTSAGKYYRTGIDPATVGSGGSTTLNTNTAGYVMTGTGTANTLSGTNTLQAVAGTNGLGRPYNAVTVSASAASTSGTPNDYNTFLHFDDPDITPTSFSTAYSLGQFATNTYAFIGAVGPNFGSYGGLQMAGRTGNVTNALPFLFNGLHGSASPTTPAILMRGGKTNGANDVTTLANTEIVFAARNWTNADAMQVKGNGDLTVTGALNMSTTVTPTSTADAQGTTGDIRYDASFIYIKTSAGWKRSALTTF